VRCEKGDASDYMETRADLVLANIVPWKLNDMFGVGKRLAARFYIISGIRESQARGFIESISSHNLELVKTETHNSWRTLLLKNRECVQ
jgi:ribosomal protein L11 methylase PrmA